MPLLGARGCLLVSCLMFSLSPLVTSLVLPSPSCSPALLSLTYGVLGAGAVTMAVIPTFLLPVTWFPNHKGKVRVRHPILISIHYISLVEYQLFQRAVKGTKKAPICKRHYFFHVRLLFTTITVM